MSEKYREFCSTLFVRIPILAVALVVGWLLACQPVSPTSTAAPTPDRPELVDREVIAAIKTHLSMVSVYGGGNCLGRVESFTRAKEWIAKYLEAGEWEVTKGQMVWAFFERTGSVSVSSVSDPRLRHLIGC